MLVMKRTPMPTRLRTEELGGAVVPWAPVGEGSTMAKGLNDPRTSILSSEITTMGPARGQPEPVESRPGAPGLEPGRRIGYQLRPAGGGGENRTRVRSSVPQELYERSPGFES